MVSTEEVGTEEDLGRRERKKRETRRALELSLIHI